MDFTGRPMKGYIFVTPNGFNLDPDLESWIQLALDYNPNNKEIKPTPKAFVLPVGQECFVD